MLHAPVGAIFVLCQKLTTQLTSHCNAFWANVYLSAMPIPPEELLTKEILKC